MWCRRCAEIGLHLDVSEVEDAHVAVHTHAHVPSAAAGAGFGERADRAGQGAGEASGPRGIIVARLDHVGAEALLAAVCAVPDLDGRNGMLRAEVELEPRSNPAFITLADGVLCIRASIVFRSHVVRHLALAPRDICHMPNAQGVPCVGARMVVWPIEIAITVLVGGIKLMG